MSQTPSPSPSLCPSVDDVLRLPADVRLSYLQSVNKRLDLERAQRWGEQVALAHRLFMERMQFMVAHRLEAHADSFVLSVADQPLLIGAPDIDVDVSMDGPAPHKRSRCGDVPALHRCPPRNTESNSSSVITTHWMPRGTHRSWPAFCRDSARASWRINVSRLVYLAQLDTPPTLPFPDEGVVRAVFRAIDAAWVSVVAPRLTTDERVKYKLVTTATTTQQPPLRRVMALAPTEHDVVVTSIVQRLLAALGNTAQHQPATVVDATDEADADR